MHFLYFAYPLIIAMSPGLAHIADMHRTQQRYLKLGYISVDLIPIDNSPLLLLPCTIDNREFYFIVDTGSEVTVVHTEIAQLIHAREIANARVIGVGSTDKDTNAKKGILKSIRIDSLVAHDVGVRIVDLGNIRSLPSKKHVAGIIGNDFLRKYQASIDLREQKIQLFNSDLYVRNLIKDDWNITSIKINGFYVPVPKINISINPVVGNKQLKVRSSNFCFDLEGYSVVFLKEDSGVIVGLYTGTSSLSRRAFCGQFAMHSGNKLDIAVPAISIINIELSLSRRIPSPGPR